MFTRVSNHVFLGARLYHPLVRLRVAETDSVWPMPTVTFI